MSRCSPAAAIRSGSRLLASLALVVAAAALGACAATTQSLPGNTAPSSPASHDHPPARYNLAGYPPAFREGFNAACDAARRHVAAKSDPARYTADPQYRQGWKDGASICRGP